MRDEALVLSKTSKKIEGVHSSAGGDVQAEFGESILHSKSSDVVSEVLVDANEFVIAADEKTEGEEGGAGSVHPPTVEREVVPTVSKSKFDQMTVESSDPTAVNTETAVDSGNAQAIDLVLAPDVNDSKKAVVDDDDTNQDVADVDTQALCVDDVITLVFAANAADANTGGEEGGTDNVHATKVVKKLLSTMLEDACATSEKNRATTIKTDATLKIQSRF